ncbi:bifunctional metallophosphatase/5'-nucleotidase [Psychroflexus sp. YR1-1]|uniref:Bifunctional metallophosphatase/5'-nucleotidase n=1 Tax=Psychroflexus aurantiacus TaxID=2709310 RepID=A0A6B3R137_9FLAO|nr:metallophosphatase [Psychroflexus aurantiacus]NEV93100.1 bifunctional metallophosphatase/5'-nucleotidase [Psychroflexus aurantiacus]
MNRSKFIKTTGAATGFLAAGGLGVLSAFKPSAFSKHLTILHTNDVHSHIDPFPANDSRYANLGGVSRRYTYIQQVRSENPNTLVLDAGDAFQGTPYFNFYGGELEYKLMSKLGYHASTIGNHEFDNGIANIAAQLQHAEFDLLSSNYNFSNTVLDGLVKSHQIYEVNGQNVGVFGLGIQLEGLVSKDLYKETEYLNPVEIAQEQTRILKQDLNCDLVICLSHLGYSYRSDKIDDLKLAALTKDIDLIIGGHTHTFLEKPSLVENLEGRKVLVNQVGWGGINVGRIDFYFDEAGETEHESLVVEV